LVKHNQKVHFSGHEKDPIKMWKLLEAAHLSKKPGARFNVYNDLFIAVCNKDGNAIFLGQNQKIENLLLCAL